MYISISPQAIKPTLKPALHILSNFKSNIRSYIFRTTVPQIIITIKSREYKNIFFNIFIAVGVLLLLTFTNSDSCLLVVFL